MGTYNFLPASMAIVGKTPKEQYVDAFQETLNQQFYNSSDWWTINEETYLGSGEYQEVDVRINTLINAETGLKLGDDWKSVLFKEIDHAIELGKLYVFDKRITIDFDPPEKHIVVGKCAKCEISSERYVNCKRSECNKHFICCELCSESDGKSYCSKNCKNKTKVFIST